LGVDGAHQHAARHAGSDVVAMRSTVGEAARWRIEERDCIGRGLLNKRRWEPFPNAPASPLGAPRDDDSAEEAA
jgi:hypothetical protein